MPGKFHISNKSAHCTRRDNGSRGSVERAMDILKRKLTTGNMGEGRGLAEVELGEAVVGTGGQPPPRRKKLKELPGEYKSYPIMVWLYNTQVGVLVSMAKLRQDGFASQRASQPPNVPLVVSA